MDIKKLIAFIVLLFYSGIVFSQNEKPNRDAFVLKLALDSTSYYQQEIQKTPYFVKDNILQIYPSEKINIEVEIENDSILSMKTVDKIEHPEKTVTIEFEQKVQGRNSEMMLLTVKNPFDKIMTYDAYMFVVGQDKLLKTSILPIKPKLTNFEMWNDVIITLALDNWKWTSE